MERKPLAAPAARAVFTIVIAALVGTVACARNGEPERVQPAPGEGIVLNDAEVTDIVITANTGEIQLSQLALARSNTEAVREFAQRMVTDHTEANEMAVAYANAANFQPQTTSTSTELEASVTETVDALNGLQGRAFDIAYIDHQIELHRWLLTTLDRTLIPASDSELEDGLTDYRAVIASHLEHAQQVRSMLN